MDLGTDLGASFKATTRNSCIKNEARKMLQGPAPSQYDPSYDLCKPDINHNLKDGGRNFKTVTERFYSADPKSPFHIRTGFDMGLGAYEPNSNRKASD